MVVAVFLNMPVPPLDKPWPRTLMLPPPAFRLPSRLTPDVCVALPTA